MVRFDFFKNSILGFCMCVFCWLFFGPTVFQLSYKLPAIIIWLLVLLSLSLLPVYKTCILTFYRNVYMCSIKLFCSLFVFFSLKQWLLVFFQVSKDLPEKQKEIEFLLKDFVELDQQLNQVILWVTPVKNQLELYNKVGQPGAFDIKVNFPPF